MTCNAIKPIDWHRRFENVFALNYRMNYQQASESLRTFIKDSFRSVVSLEEETSPCPFQMT